MASFTLTDLQRVLVSCAGESGNTDSHTEKSEDQTFEEWGYDSIALLESVSIIQQEYGVRIEDESVDSLTTPSLFVEHVQGLLVDKEKESTQ